MLKGTVHVAKSLAPGSISQFKRIERAVRGKADKKYGETFELKDELPGLAGFRTINSNPEKAMTYMITSFGSNLKKADNLFTSALLKGGRVDPKSIVDRYKYSEQRRFAFMRDMYKDIEAARTLGVPESVIRRKLSERKGLSKNIIREIMGGVYTPKQPSEFFVTRMRKINNDLNEKEGVEIENPFSVARPFINNVISSNRNISLLGDEFTVPEFELPETSATTSPLGAQVQAPPLNTPMPAPITPVSPQTQSTQANNYASLFPRDELGNLIAQKKNI